MLHALIFALNGFPGNIFVQNKDDTIRVASDLPFLHAQEREELESLCQIASYYLRFKNFIKRYKKFSLRPAIPPPTPASSEEEGLVPGLYVRSFAYGLEETLTPYNHLILALEQESLRDPHLPLAHLKARLGDYFVLFPVLARIIEEVVAFKAHGCFVLELVHRHSSHGVPAVQNAVKKLLVYCQTPFYKQLVSWMLHGSLFDPFDEFFIEVKAPANNETQEIKSESPSIVVYEIKGDLLPAYIGQRVADKILFVGQAVSLFRCEEVEQKQRVRMSKATDELVAMAESYSRKLIQLQNASEFRLSEFETTVDEIRGVVAELLWKLMVQEADLIGQLKVIKDFYLLGRGELFLTFIDQAMPLLCVPPNSKTEHDINVSLQQAYRQLLADDDILHKEFRLTIDTKDFPKKGGFLAAQALKKQQQQQQQDVSKQSDQSVADSTAGSVSAVEVKNGWQQLGLLYTPTWPLHLLFTPKILRQLDAVFRFLIYIKRVQIEIQQTWMDQMGSDVGKKKTFTVTKFWQLRNHMGFLIDNLQYYLQVDVIESQFLRLLEKMRGTRDFEECRLALDTFLAKLQAQCFLQERVISKCIENLVKQCEALTRLSRLLMDSAQESVDSNEELESISKSFSAHSIFLFKCLNKSETMHSSPHLSQLLMRLDFNGYYSESGGTLGTK